MPGGELAVGVEAGAQIVRRQRPEAAVVDVVLPRPHRLGRIHIRGIPRKRLFGLLDGIGILDVVSDSRLKGDAAILESEIGVVEASVDMQLQALEKGFKKMLGSRV